MLAAVFTAVFFAAAWVLRRIWPYTTLKKVESMLREHEKREMAQLTKVKEELMAMHRNALTKDDEDHRSMKREFNEGLSGIRTDLNRLQIAIMSAQSEHIK
jgi:hypothetical protein